MSKLKTLVAAAVANEVELKRLGAQDGQLSKKSYLIASENVAGASKAEADTLEAAMTGHEGPLLGPSLRRLQKAISGFRRSAPIAKIGSYFDHEADSALGRLSCTRQSLYLVAARRLAADRPELFGTMSKVNEFADAIAKCLAERVRLFAEIATGWDANDVLVDGDRVSFRMSNGVVTVSENLAENLVNYCVVERDQAQAA
jgi:hypothetical protein